MRYPLASFITKNNMLFWRSIMFMFLTCISIRTQFCCSSNPSSLRTLAINGHLTFDEVHDAAKDFGNRLQMLPLAVLHPKSVSDIATTIKHIWQLGSDSEITVAARGHGHSLQGQAQAHRGIVINMEALRSPEMHFYTGMAPYVDVSGGELWINVLHESLKYGLAPKSWTDYLHLTIGGTLSNAGISGQAFHHGPQISNVYQLEVVTGKGEVLNCSEKQNSDLFYSVLGGLGQFGIITRARISLEAAPQKVKWIRVLYSDFTTFARDQERLIASDNAFDYIEGFVTINRTGLLNNWRSSFDPQDPVQASQFRSDGKTLFCLELVKYFNTDETKKVNEVICNGPSCGGLLESFKKTNKYISGEKITEWHLNVCFTMQDVTNQLSQLGYIKSTLFLTEVSYVEFLDRVHVSEIKLRSKGLWEVPHPWLNLLIPKSKIQAFAVEVFGDILTETSNGPILIYPVNKSKWDDRTSAVIPEEDIFYLVAFLSSAVPSSTGTDSLEHILNQNRRILEFCETANLGVKQYLPHYTTQEEWRAHFGPRWEVFVQRKSTYDPLAILAPGQRIFQKAIPFS